MIPYGKHTITQDDINAVTETLQNQFLTQGKAVPQFEQALCEYTGAQFAVAVNSGTSALHLACLSLDINNDDIVWTVPNTFAASANCARYCGAEVDFVDIDVETRLISIDKLHSKLKDAKKQNTLPKALIVVHFAGHMCDMESLSSLAAEFGFAIIEDAAHAFGSSYKGKYKAGKPQHSSITILSFHPVKSITTAEGGALLTDSTEIAEKAKLYSSHGITKNANSFRCEKPSIAHYEQHTLGFNYRLSDLHAALGISQINRLDQLIAQRRKLAERYYKKLVDLPVKLPINDANSAWHLFVIELLEHDRDQIFQTLLDNGIAANVHYIPVHWHPYYQQLGFKKGQFENSENYYRRAISLPLFPELTLNEQDHVTAVLREALT